MKKRYFLFALVIPCLLVMVWALAGTGSKEETQRATHFYFVQITDTHFGDADNTERAARTVEAINKLPMRIEFVVHTGDILNNEIENSTVVDETLSTMGKLAAPIHFVPGNHDILRDQNKEQATATIFKKRFGPLCHKKEYNGIVFLFVYTEPLAKGFTLNGLDVMGWVEQSLIEAAGKPVIVLHHTPSVEFFYDNEMHQGWPQEVRQKWNALMNSSDVKAVIAGHFHGGELHWLGDVPLYVSSPVAGYRGRQATFRIFEYRSGKLGYRTQYIH